LVDKFPVFLFWLGYFPKKSSSETGNISNLIKKLILFDIWDFNLHIEWLLSKMVITEIKNRGDYQIDS
jgi:hypothetical protein